MRHLLTAALIIAIYIGEDRGAFHTTCYYESAYGDRVAITIESDQICPATIDI